MTATIGPASAQQPSRSAAVQTGAPRRFRLAWPSFAFSIRLRLALLYTAVFGLSLLATDVLVYLGLERYLASELDRSLTTQAVEIAGTTRVESGFVLGVRTLNVVLPDLDVFAAPGLYVQVVDRGGQVRARSGNLGQAQLPVSPAALVAALDGEDRFETVTIGETRLRSYYRPLRLGSDVVGVLQVARSRHDLDAALGQLQLVFGAIGAVSLLAASLAGFGMARVALRPIDRLTRAARAIGEARDFTRRVSVDGTSDEVGRLAATFNEMLGQLQAAHAELTQALAAEQRFVADASHELRTPLATIRANLELIQRVDDLSASDREAALADALAEVERLGRLVADLLTLARADAGLHLQRQPVRLDTILHDTHRQARWLALAREQRVVLVKTAETWVEGNADALRQLLLILVDNALKYSPDGGEVRLSLRRDGGMVRLIVSDDGEGIAPEDVPHIFERFYRADRARTGSGTGLGLAIARWIVDEHGGTIAVESQPGRGSTFTVTLAAISAPSTTPGPASSGDPAQQTSRVQGTRPR